MKITNGTWESVKAGYLRQVEKALASAGHREKKQVLEDVSSHLDRRYTELSEDERTWENFQQIITEMGPASDYAELLESSTPKSNKKKMFVSVIIVVAVVAVAIIFAPYVLKKLEIARGTVDVEAFRENFAEKLEKLDIDNADLKDVISMFGKPLNYVWGQEKFDPDNLPQSYIANYSDDFSIYFSEGKIVELRHEGPDFTFMGKINVGTPLAEVLDVFGMPDETVEGGKNRFQDNVLYMDIDGRKGHCYYGRTDKNARFWFLNYEVIAIYTTRSDYGEDEVAKSPKILEKIKRSVIEKLSAGKNDGDATDMAERWLRLIDDGNYGASWEEAADIFKNAATKEQWAGMAKTVRQPLGKVISRRVMTKMPTQTVPGGPDGEYVIIQFKASFENKADAIETVTPMLDKDGVWRVTGYYIR